MHSRLTTLTYPNGRAIGYDYSPSNGLNDTSSRLSGLTDSGTTLEGYAYLGRDRIVKRAHAQLGVDLTYVKLSGESNVSCSSTS